jgi:hypothetical protein
LQNIAFQSDSNLSNEKLQFCQLKKKETNSLCYEGFFRMDNHGWFSTERAFELPSGDKGGHFLNSSRKNINKVVRAKALEWKLV